MTAALREHTLQILLAFFVLTATREKVRIDLVRLKKDVRRYGLLCAACAIYLIVGGAAIYVSAYYNRLTMGPILLLAADFALLVWLLSFLRRRFGVRLNRGITSQGRLGTRLVLIYISAATAAIVFNAIQAALGNLVIDNPAAHLPVVTYIRKMLFYALTMGVYMNAGEELLFRVALISLLEKVGIRAQKAQIYISGVIFGFAHLLNLAFPHAPPTQFVIFQCLYATAMGVVLGHVYLAREKSFVHPAVLHWSMNMAGNYGVWIMTAILLNI